MVVRVGFVGVDLPRSPHQSCEGKTPDVRANVDHDVVSAELGRQVVFVMVDYKLENLLVARLRSAIKLLASLRDKLAQLRQRTSFIAKSGARLAQDLFCFSGAHYRQFSAEG